MFVTQVKETNYVISHMYLLRQWDFLLLLPNALAIAFSTSI